jgi:hypothetical protein
MSSQKSQHADWQRELENDVDHNHSVTMFWPRKSVRLAVRDIVRKTMRRKGFMSDKESMDLMIKLLPDTHEKETSISKLVKPSEICDKLGVSIRGKISSGTAQGIVFSAIHEASESKLIVKISEQRTKHTNPSIGWASSDDAMVEGKILCFANEAAAALESRFVPRYFGQFLVDYKGDMCTMMIQEDVPFDLEEAIEACSSSPVALLSFLVEMLASINLMHSIGIVHNDLHWHNIRARTRSKRSIFKSPRDGKEHESVCPFEIIIIDLGRACIRDGVCSRTATRHAPSDRVHVDMIRILTAMRTKIFSAAAKMLSSHEICSNWKDICILLCIMQFFSTAIGFVWDERRSQWIRPFLSDGSYRGKYSESIDICRRQGNIMPFASSHYLFVSKHGPPLLELLPPPSPPRKRSEDVKNIYFEQKATFV